jgi:uncharacterized protein (DUF488 family)
MSTLRLATVGYEKATVDELIAKLKAAKVKLLIDVRAVAASRRAGFSKTRLAASLDEAGIAYIHLRDLGTPAAGRQAARAGRVAEMQAIYEGWLEEPRAQLALAEAEALIQKRRSALLCLEADAADCHRRIVALRLKERTGCTVVDL